MCDSEFWRTHIPIWETPGYHHWDVLKRHKSESDSHCSRKKFKQSIHSYMEKGMETHSSILAWGTPWMAEPGGLQSMGSWRVGHDLATNTYIHVHHDFTGLNGYQSGLLDFLANSVSRPKPMTPTVLNLTHLRRFWESYLIYCWSWTSMERNTTGMP